MTYFKTYDNDNDIVGQGLIKQVCMCVRADVHVCSSLRPLISSPLCALKNKYKQHEQMKNTQQRVDQHLLLLFLGKQRS